MKKRSSRKSAPAIQVSPLQATPSPNRSPSESPPMNFEFSFNTNFNPTGSTSSLKRNNNGEGSVKKKNISSDAAATTPARMKMQPTGSPPSLTKSISSISDLKDLAASRLDSIKRHVDCSHSEILKDVEASHSRLHKRFKIQTQACQQLMDEAEKEYKKMTERITETRDAMKASYMEFIAEAQASASRVCKTSIPELSQSFERAFDGLRSRYGVASISS